MCARIITSSLNAFSDVVEFSFPGAARAGLELLHDLFQIVSDHGGLSMRKRGRPVEESLAARSRSKA